jgi:hypothetical protein
MKTKNIINKKGGGMKVSDTQLAVDFLWLNYPLSLDFDVKPMIKFIKSSRKIKAKMIDTNAINNEMLILKLKTKFYA